ncbi:DUF551 domain-containing protein [Bacteroides neonati]|uniref:DUF551 domain-containing protein n=1 Tax=Bacteroides neonati TaxID=1347393 RepID=UPI0005A62EF9|nr:DUF551 domain-containing protein [Bacteroides neonati]
MTELEKAASEELLHSYAIIVDGELAYQRQAMLNMFHKGAEWKAKQSPWIRVEERLPDPGKLVNVRCRNKNKEDGIWLCDVCFIDEDTNTWGERHHTWETITHWMPIPE